MVIVLLIFGAGKMPQIGGAMGKAIRNFKSGITGRDDESDDESDDLKLEENSDKSKSKK